MWNCVISLAAVLAEAREGIIDTIRDESPELAFKSSFDIDLLVKKINVNEFRNVCSKSLEDLPSSKYPKLHVRTCTAPVVRNGMFGVPMKPLDESTKGAELIGPSPEACVTNSSHTKLSWTLSICILFQKSVHGIRTRTHGLVHWLARPGCVWLLAGPGLCFSSKARQILTKTEDCYLRQISKHIIYIRHFQSKNFTFSKFRWIDFLRFAKTFQSTWPRPDALNSQNLNTFLFIAPAEFLEPLYLVHPNSGFPPEHFGHMEPHKYPVLRIRIIKALENVGHSRYMETKSEIRLN